MFAGSESGGLRAGATYRLIGSVKLKGLDPEASLPEAVAGIVDDSITASKCFWRGISTFLRARKNKQTGSE